MKLTRVLLYIAALALFTHVAIPVRLAAQAKLTTFDIPGAGTAAG